MSTVDIERQHSMIYVVTEGSYSDYHIVGVYDDEQLATGIAAHIGGKVETFTLNPNKDNLNQGLLPYKVIIDRHDGATAITAGYGCNEHWSEYGTDYIRSDFGGRIVLSTEVWARDEQHVAKIANERRAFLIAEGIFDNKEMWYKPLGYWK